MGEIVRAITGIVYILRIKALSWEPGDVGLNLFLQKKELNLDLLSSW